MGARFDFDAKGYESPADWARLWDLVPDGLDRKARQAFERAADHSKGALVGALEEHGVKVLPYDPATVGSRNEAKP